MKTAVDSTDTRGEPSRAGSTTSADFRARQFASISASYESPLAAIAELESACRELSDQEILDRSRALRARARSGERA